jgi:hypothetical protein
MTGGERADGVGDGLDAEVGDVMGGIRREVEAAVRVPPFAVVVRRHHRRRRRRVAAGGVVLATAAVAAVLALPAIVGPRDRGETPTAAISVSVAPVTGTGLLSLSDVSFAGPQMGALLGRRCAASCSDVVLTTSDGGTTYGPETAVQGNYRYVAAGTQTDIAYAPDLAIRHAGDAGWSVLAAPAPVADVSVAGPTVLVLLVPPGRPAQLWSGPTAADSWSAYEPVTSVPGSDDTARLLRPTADSVVVVSNAGMPRSIVGSLLGAGGAVGVRWAQPTDIAVCGPGSSAAVSAASPTTWWVACDGERDSDPMRGQEIAVTTDGGRTYTDASPPAALSTSTQQLVTVTSPTTAYLSGGPALLLTQNGGVSWHSVLALPGLGIPHVPPGTGGQDVWLVASGGTTVYRSTGGAFTGLRLR